MTNEDRHHLDRLAAEGTRARRAPVAMGTVTAVDTTAGEATVELSDGTTIPIYPVGGYLPAVGDQVPLIANGGDMLSLVPRHMVDGDLQSKDFVEGEAGWRITADGNLEANDGHFRGTITTGTGGATRVELARGPIEGSEDEWAIRFHRNDTDYRPAHIAMTDDGVMIASHRPDLWDNPPPPAQLFVVRRDGVTRVEMTAQVVEVFGYDVVVGGVSIRKPPLRAVRRGAAQSIPNNTFTTLIPTESIESTNDAYLGTPSVAVDYTTGTLTPQKFGLYLVTVSATWSAGVAAPGSIGVRYGGADLWLAQSADIGMLGGQQNVTTDLVRVNGFSDTIEARAWHNSGAARGCQLTRFSVRRVAD